jgi:hypothetical protein
MVPPSEAELQLILGPSYGSIGSYYPRPSAATCPSGEDLCVNGLCVNSTSGGSCPKHNGCPIDKYLCASGKCVADQSACTASACAANEHSCGYRDDGTVICEADGAAPNCMNYAVRYKATAGTTTIGKQDVTVEYASTVEGKPVLSMAFPSGLLGSMRTGAISCGPVADSELANYNVRITQSRQADWNGLETLDFTSGVISAAVRCDLPKAPFDLNAQLTFAIDLGWVSATSKANHLAKATNPTAITGASADDLCLGYLTSGNTFSCVPGATGSTGVPELNYETDQSTDWDIMKDVVTYETKKLGDGVTS